MEFLVAVIAIIVIKRVNLHEFSSDFFSEVPLTTTMTKLYCFKFSAKIHKHHQQQQQRTFFTFGL